MRTRVRRALYSLSDWLCHLAGVHSDAGVQDRWRLLLIGQHVGELAWRLRKPGSVPRWCPEAARATLSCSCQEGCVLPERERDRRTI